MSVSLWFRLRTNSHQVALRVLVRLCEGQGRNAGCLPFHSRTKLTRQIWCEVQCLVCDTDSGLQSCELL